MKLFDMENKFWTAMSEVADLVILEILWFICCIPIITIGASTTAFYYATNKVVRKHKSGVLAAFFGSFKTNLKQGIIAWIPCLIILIFLISDIMICGSLLAAGESMGVLVYVFYVALILFLIWMSYLFAYLARFEDTVRTSMKNAMIMMFANIKSSMLLLATWTIGMLIMAYILMISWLVPAAMMLMVTVIIEKVFRKYMTEEERELEEEDDNFTSDFPRR